jgi:2-succinyl-5-enolpyruvyl-6-hydroxy-3-cyclohexene-1-carboxylate synthase
VFDSQLVLAHYDVFLRHADIQPDMVIRFGRKPTSKVLCKLLNNWGNNTILVDAWQQYNDDCPNFIQYPILNYCREQVEKIDWQSGTDWVNKLLSLENTVENEIQKDMMFHEGTIARVCFESLEGGGQLFVGNSMPVRDVDMFTSTSHKRINIYSNRGASGIDGVISTALGMCLIVGIRFHSF